MSWLLPYHLPTLTSLSRFMSPLISNNNNNNNKNRKGDERDWEERRARLVYISDTCEQWITWPNTYNTCNWCDLHVSGILDTWDSGEWDERDTNEICYVSYIHVNSLGHNVIRTSYIYFWPNLFEIHVYVCIWRYQNMMSYAILQTKCIWIINSEIYINK